MSTRQKIYLTTVMILNMLLLINHSSPALGKSPGDLTTIYVYLNFEGSVGLSDLNGDGTVDVLDGEVLIDTVGKCIGDSGFISEADYNGDGCVTNADLQFLQDRSFPSITYSRNTLGLARFTAEVFNLPFPLPAFRDVLVIMIKDRVQEDYQDFSNVEFVTDVSDLDWWYTWGIDDSAFVYDTGVGPDWFENPDILPIDPYSPCPDDAFGNCRRLFGKAGNYADIYETDAWGNLIFHPMHARTFAGSFALGEGCADWSEPPLFWGDSLPGTGKIVDLDRLANALGNSASHEIGHMFGARHSHGDIMTVESERREAFWNKSFSASSINVLTATLVEAATADQFEPSDLPLAAADVSNGNYPNLTLDNPFDEDFYRVTITEDDSSEVRFSFSIDRTNYGGGVLPLMNHWMNIAIRYQDCEGEGCPWIQVSHHVTDYGYIYEEVGVPPGRIYEIHVFQFAPRQPMKYGMEIAVGEYIPPDQYDVDIDTDFDGTPDVMNENDSQATATEWSSGCDFSGDLTIHDDSDVDWYKIEALGYSVKAEISFDPARGDLQLFLDDIQATESTLSGDGTKKTLIITGCGLSPSMVRIQGEANYYSLCIQRIPVQEGCEEYQAWTTFSGSGTFHFRRSSLWVPGQVDEREVPVNKQMFAKLLESSPTSVTWQLCGTVDYGNGFNQLFIGNLEIPRPNVAGPVPFNPTLPGNPYILREAVPGRVAWYQVLPVGHGEGTFGGQDDAIVAFNVSCEGLQWNASIPDDQGTLVFEARIDTDGDLIPDEVEITTGTNPNIDDTDGDGLLDGTEDTNQDGVVNPGETDPRLWDTDGDGVSDGVERGLTSPEGNDTDPATFKPDSDPSTTTDPTESDTDGDGLSDGEEDANQNGRLDPSETSPIDRTFVGNTPIGSNIVVIVADDVTITFDNVTDSGDTTVTESDTGPPANFQTSCTPPVYYDITTTATYSGTIQVCLTYDDTACNDAGMHLFHYEGGIWVDVTTSVDTVANIICGEVTSLSEFLLATYTGRIFVDADATGANNGRSWADAYIYLQDALANAVSGDEIFVAEGTYKPDQKRGQMPGDRKATFQLINGVAIKGGYGGFGQPDPDVRDIDAYRTILSGDIGWGWFDADNSYHVVTNSGTDGTAVLDGFTITAGNADGSYPDNMGGGMYNHSGSRPTIINCRLRGNAAFSAGAMFNSVSSPTLINCIIAENSVQGNGGGMHSFYSNLTLVNCIFSGNRATHGGAMYNQRSTPTLINCSLSGNAAGRTGGGIYNNNSDPILTNSILWGNSTFFGTYSEVGQIANNPGSTPLVHYCCVQGWTGRLGGRGNIGDDPLFVDPPDNLRLSSHSPCIDAGDNTAVPARVTTDLDGHRRIVDGDYNFTRIVDMGAYEFVRKN